MTTLIFVFLLSVFLLSAVIWVWMLSLPRVVKLYPATDAVLPPTAATISIMFALFVAFGASEVSQRERELRLAVQKEASVARSILKFAESVGPSASPVRQAMIEYLQAITTLEVTWLERVTGTESPAQPAADTMVQVVTLFIGQSTAPPLVKSLLIGKVDELGKARIERISLAIHASSLPQWIGLTIITSITQLIIALGYVGKRNAMRTAVGVFTLAACTMLVYLAWIDGLIGPPKIRLVMQTLKDVLLTISF